MLIGALSNLHRVLALCGLAWCGFGAPAFADAPIAYEIASRTSVQAGSLSKPAVAAFLDGGYVLVTELYGPDSPGLSLTIIDPSGQRSSVHLPTIDQVTNYSVATDANHYIIVTYALYAADDERRGVWLAKLSRAGAVLFEKLVFKNKEFGYASRPQVTPLAGGRYAVSYMDPTGVTRVDGKKRFYTSVSLVICASNGDVVSVADVSVPEDRIVVKYGHALTDKIQFDLPNVTPLPSGGMIVAWQHAYLKGTGKRRERSRMAVSEFDADGFRVGAAKYVNGPKSEIGRDPTSTAAVAILPMANGRYATLMAADYQDNFYSGEPRTKKLYLSSGEIASFDQNAKRLSFPLGLSVLRTGDQRAALLYTRNDKCFLKVLDYRDPDDFSETRLDEGVGKGVCSMVGGAVLANGDIVAVLANRRAHNQTQFYETILTPAD